MVDARVDRGTAACEADTLPVASGATRTAGMCEWFDVTFQFVVVSQGISGWNAENCPGFTPPKTAHVVCVLLGG